MKTNYKIGEIVEINNSNETVKITDFEFFGDLILYYTDNGKAYPEGELNQVGVNSITELLNTSGEEKNRQYQEIRKKFKLL
jgi:hypothetical protein